MADLESLRTFRFAFEEAPHLKDPTSAVGAWFTQPLGMVFQLVRRARFTNEMARWVAGPAIETFWELAPQQTGVVLVLDVSLMDGRDSEVRSIIQAAAEKYHARIARSIVIPPRTANAAYMKALQVSVVLLRVFGVTVEIATPL